MRDAQQQGCANIIFKVGDMRAGEMAQSVEGLLYQREDLSLIPQNLHEKAWHSSACL